MVDSQLQQPKFGERGQNIYLKGHSETLNMERNLSADQKNEKHTSLVEVSNIEKQLWASINCKGLLQPEVQKLYRRVCSSYERIILKKFDDVNLQEVEYSLWKLHYKHIDEFRRQIKKGSAGSSSYIEGLKLFISDATEFYKSLLLKLQSQSVLKVRFEENWELQLLCHRFLICLGDLARYRELFEKPDGEARNWSVAAGHYIGASRICPESGNPHNQLALLATYVGDEFLALYHCVRSLAVKEPFPDARNNLLLLLEKSRPSTLSSESREVPFNFLRPSERRNSYNHQIPNDGQSCSPESKLWPLIVRIASFFYIGSSFDEFPSAFATVIQELETLTGLDDTKLADSLKSYQFTDLADEGPSRAVQAVCTFIFVMHNLSENPLLQNPEEQNGSRHQLLLRKYVICSIFIFMGRLVDLSLEACLVEQCPLLPSILVFTEWLVSVPDALVQQDSTEEERAAVSYFLTSLANLVNSLKACKVELGSRDRAVLWEDYELRGFAPLAKSHISLDFSTSSSQANSFQSGSTSRARRILSAAKKTEERYQKWLFHGTSSPIFSSTTKFEHKAVTVDEEEVILFKPLTRYNSAPLEVEDIDEPIVASDECLRRTQTAMEFQPFKQPEAAVSAGPPSLSAWVLNAGTLGISKENRLSPIDELASRSLANLSIKTSYQEKTIPDSSLESVITHYPPPPLPPPPYLAPIPSAPLLPEDATWYSGTQPSGVSYSGFAPQPPAGLMNLAYPVSRGLSSSEWLRKFREINSLHPGNNQILTPNLLGNFDPLAGPAPLGSNQMVYLSPKPLLHPDFYYQGPVAYGCSGVVANPVRDDQMSLLQYLKEREWRLQQDPAVRGPTFLGN